MEEKKKMIKYRDPKDVAVGVFFMIGGLFFFVIIV